MSQPIELFATWSAKFSVTLVPPLDGEDWPSLRFIPKRRHWGHPISQDLFTDWFRTSRNGQPLSSPLKDLVLMAQYSGLEQELPALQAQALVAAQRLGPLFTGLQWQRSAQQRPITEPLRKWHTAAQSIYRLIINVEKMQSASKDRSYKARFRRAYFAADMDHVGQLYLFSVENQREKARNYLKVLSEYGEYQERVAYIVDSLWLLTATNEHVPVNDVPRPRLDSSSGRFQLNMPFGIQALVVMALFDEDLGRGQVIRACARERCRRTVLMRPNQKYCEERCRQLDANSRYQAKQKQKRKSTATRSRSARLAERPR